MSSHSHKEKPRSMQVGRLRWHLQFACNESLGEPHQAGTSGQSRCVGALTLAGVDCVHPAASIFLELVATLSAAATEWGELRDTCPACIYGERIEINHRLFGSVRDDVILMFVS